MCLTIIIIVFCVTTAYVFFELLKQKFSWGPVLIGLTLSLCKGYPFFEKKIIHNSCKLLHIVLGYTVVPKSLFQTTFRKLDL